MQHSVVGVAPLTVPAYYCVVLYTFALPANTRPLFFLVFSVSFSVFDVYIYIYIFFC